MMFGTFQFLNVYAIMADKKSDPRSPFLMINVKSSKLNEVFRINIEHYFSKIIFLELTKSPACSLYI